MCRRVMCRRCDKPTWTGCGAHVEAVLGDVALDDRCSCGRSPSAPRTGSRAASWVRRLNPSRMRRASAVIGVGLVLSGCGSSGGDGAAPAASATAQSAASQQPAQAEVAGGVRAIGPGGFASEVAPASGRVVIDVRTPEEFASGHLERAEMIDFSAPDFAERVAELDPSKPYAIYCRSGNRSGQTAEMMRRLGFLDVVDLDGGIVAWQAEGRAVIAP